MSWFSGPGFCSCPSFHLGLAASDCSPGLAFCSTGPWTLLGSAACSSPHQPCKNRIHSTCFSSTRGNAPILFVGIHSGNHSKTVLILGTHPPFTGVARALRAQTPKKSETSLAGLRPQDLPSVWEKSRKRLATASHYLAVSVSVSNLDANSEIIFMCCPCPLTAARGMALSASTAYITFCHEKERERDSERQRERERERPPKK